MLSIVLETRRVLSVPKNVHDARTLNIQLLDFILFRAILLLIRSILPAPLTSLHFVFLTFEFCFWNSFVL